MRRTLAPLLDVALVEASPATAQVPPSSDPRIDAWAQTIKRQRPCPNLLLTLRELDEDASTGRISPADRLDGRHALGPSLCTITETLRAASADQTTTR